MDIYSPAVESMITEIVIRQGNLGDWIYVVQGDQVEVVAEMDPNRVQLAVRSQGDSLGEKATFEWNVRKAAMLALGKERVRSIDRMNFARRIQEDPSVAYRLVMSLLARIRELSMEVARLGGENQAGSG